jgi:hypothetical protein
MIPSVESSALFIRTTAHPAPSLETNVRLFLAALTVGAAGIGYALMQQAAEPTPDPRSASGRPLFDWQSAGDTLDVATADVAAQGDEPPLVVRDTITNTRTEVASALDEFVRVNGESNDVPVPTDIGAEADQPTTARANASPVALAAGEQSAAKKESVADEESIVGEPTAPDATAPDSIDYGSANVGSEADVNPETGAADASAAVNRPNPNPIRQDEPSGESSLANSEPAAGSVSSPPAANEATLVTKKNGPKSEPATTLRPNDVASKQPKTELLPGGKMPGKAAVFDPEWKVIGKTINGLPMHTRRFGRQGTRTLVIAGLDGLDRVATRWNDELAGELTRNRGLLITNELLLLRAGNPDGLVAKMPGNAHGVLINRNFPGRRYQFLNDKSAGPGPASEAETHAILDVLYSFRPRRVVHLTSTTGRSTVIYNRAAKGAATDLEKQFKLNGQPLDVELVPGSLEDFADGTLDAAVMTLQLNTGTDWRKAWQEHLPMLLAAIDGQIPVETVSQDELAQSSPDQVGSPIPNLEDDPAPVRKRRRGYEELPPPPR